MGRTVRVLFVLLAVKWLENERRSFANDRVHVPVRPFPPSDGHWDREPLGSCPECVMIECMDRRRVREVVSLIWRRRAASLWHPRMFPRGNRSVDNPHLQQHEKENSINQNSSDGLPWYSWMTVVAGSNGLISGFDERACWSSPNDERRPEQLGSVDQKTMVMMWQISPAP